MLFLFSVLVFMSFMDFQNYEETEKPYKTGEYFKFKVSYSRFLSAGYATLELTESVYDNKSVYYAKGFGANTGLSKIFFRVKDHYQSYFDKETGKPYLAVRDVSEGSYKRKQEVHFNENKNQVLFKDFTKEREVFINIPPNVYDVISAFYYLRNHKDIDNLKTGQTLDLDMFFDDDLLKFRLKFVGTEHIKTKFGHVSAMVFKPLVLTGRVFKEKESLTIWISNDKNKIPLRVKADLTVGSISMDLHQYKGLKHPFNTK